MTCLCCSGRVIMVDPIEALDRRARGRLIPEWGAVRDLPPRDDPFLTDRHLVEVAPTPAR